MNFNDYQSQAMVFRKPSADNIYAVLGLAEEAGEVAGKMAKARRDGAEPEVLRNMMQKELGDVLWMCAAIAQDFGLSLSYVAEQNLEKLNSRLARGTISGSGDNR